MTLDFFQPNSNVSKEAYESSNLFKKVSVLVRQVSQCLEDWKYSLDILVNDFSYLESESKHMYMETKLSLITHTFLYQNNVFVSFYTLCLPG